MRRGFVFGTVSLALLMMSVDSTIVATALHALEHGLGTSVNWASWTITAYSVGFVLMLPVSGRLSDQLGRRRVFLWSVLVFTVASLCCGLADNVYELIGLRALQAAGGAAFTPSATGIVVDYFGPARDRAVSLFSSIFPVGAMIGPIFGGLFVSYWSWRGIFFVNVPIGMLVAGLCLRYVPPDAQRSEIKPRSMDPAGMILLGLALLGVMLAAAHLGDRGSTVDSTMFVMPIVVALICIILFVRHIGRAVSPLIEPRLIYGRELGPVNAINAAFTGIPLGVVALIPLYAVTRYGLGPLTSGSLLVAEGGAAIAFSILGTMMLRRTGYRAPLYVGSAVNAIGLLLLAVHAVAVPPYVWLSVGAFILGLGYGTINPASRNAGLQLAPADSATIAALRTMFVQIGAIATISITTAVLARSGDPGNAQGWIYGLCAVLILASLPVVRLVPEHRGAW